MPTVQEPWIQVFGQITVHRAGRDPVTLKGSTKTLLAALVAAGPAGATTDELANIYWKNDRPASWQVALRSAMSHLQTQLTGGFRIANENGHVTLIADAGWIDAWRVEQQGPFDERPAWVRDGRPYGDVYGMDSVDAAIERLVALLPADAGSRPSTPTAAIRLQAASTAILLGPADQHLEVLGLSKRDQEIQTLVVGDADLLMPLGPYSVAFPALRHQLDTSPDLFEASPALTAWHIISGEISAPSCEPRPPYRLIIDKAEQLDHLSLRLTSLLVERRPASDFSMVICADKGITALRWLDFMDRARTAGARVIELD